MFWYVVLLLQDTLLIRSSNPCEPLCIQNVTSVLEADNITIGIYYVSTVLPTSTIVIVTSIWSVQQFKKCLSSKKSKTTMCALYMYMCLLCYMHVACT